MAAHPIEGIMESALRNIKEMVDVNTIVGTPVKCDDGTVIIPVSRVSFGFGAGGSEFGKPGVAEDGIRANFGGGSGAGVSINPDAFLVVSNGEIKMLTLGEAQSSFDKLAELIPDILSKFKDMLGKKKTSATAEAVTAEETIVTE